MNSPLTVPVSSALFDIKPWYLEDLARSFFGRMVSFAGVDDEFEVDFTDVKDADVGKLKGLDMKRAFCDALECFRIPQ